MFPLRLDSTQTKPNLHRLLRVLPLVLGLSLATSRAQTPVPQASSTLVAGHAATLAEVTATRDAFIARVRSLGLSCPIAPPQILVEDIPSYGQYNDETNTLRTSDWSVLQPEEKAFAFRIAPPGATEATARVTFNDVTHRWIFIHEMGHWWQSCQKADTKSGRPPYAIEYEADRIAMAYWNEVDPSLPAKMVTIAQSVIDHMPNPVHGGQGIASYFNANYETLGPSPAYPWFQARMIVDCGEEMPKPTLAQTLVLGKK